MFCHLLKSKRVTDLQTFLDESGTTPDGNKSLAEISTLGTETSPVYFFLKSGNERENHNGSDVTYIFQMIDDAVDQVSCFQNIYKKAILYSRHNTF